jgi:ATP-dependent DNA helicase RecQ
MASVRLIASRESALREVSGDAISAAVVSILFRVLGPEAHRPRNLDSRALRELRRAASGDQLHAALRRMHAARVLEWKPWPDEQRIELLGDWPVHRLPVDWSLLHARRMREERRLDAMEGYVLCDGCRRGYLLRYFGDPDAMQSCTSCDRCLGPSGALIDGAIPPGPPAGRHALRRWVKRIHLTRK